MKTLAIILSLLFATEVLLAASTTSTTLAVITASTMTSSVVDTLKEVEGKIPVSLPLAATILIALLSEVALRIFPTKKPKSLLLLVSSVLGVIGSISTKISNLLDQVVQNIKDPEVAEEKKK